MHGEKSLNSKIHNFISGSGIETELRAERCGIRITARERVIPLLQNVKTGSGAHPVHLHFIGYRVSFPTGEVAEA
jgi:hypothetical protein